MFSDNLICIGCGEDDPSVVKEYEVHHIFGVANSPETVPLCLNCHSRITELQNKLPVKARKANASEEDKHAYADVTIGGLQKLLAERLIKRGLNKYGKQRYSR